MSCINKQSIYKAFYQLDKQGIPFRPVDDVDTDDFKSVKARSALCKVWLDALTGLEEETWCAVVRMVLAECKQYPSVEQLYEFISRVPSDNGIAANEAPAPAPKPKPVRRAAKTQVADERLQRMFALAKEGRWKEAAACTKAAGAEAKLDDFAKKHFPAKYSPSWVERNHEELTDIMREEERCTACTGYHRCTSMGITYIGVLDKFGNIAVKGMECIKKVKANEKVL